MTIARNVTHELEETAASPPSVGDGLAENSAAQLPVFGDSQDYNGRVAQARARILSWREVR
jgi:hypothetical protein